MFRESLLSVTGESSSRRLSTMAGGLVGSEILKIASDIRAMVAEGKTICNLTVGDFSPSEFHIPRFFEDNIKEAITRGETNYPPSDGMPILKKSIVAFYERWLALSYTLDSVLVTGGSRPGIYTAYQALVDPGDLVIYPVPSWNNNHYCRLVGAREVPVPCTSETAFLPSGELLRDAVRGARLVSCNSPLNPTGTAFSESALASICDLILEENARRSTGERPLYLLYDQVYWMLTFGKTRHCNPVSLRPEMARYTIFVDGISKAFAATGIRVGWTIGPPDIIGKMASILGHVGAWAPRAEQVATARLLSATEEIKAYHKNMKRGIRTRLNALYDGICALRSDGFGVNAIAPMGAIYLSVNFDLIGKKDQHGAILRTNEDIRKYLLGQAGIAIVPFQAFGSMEDSGWFRLSVGAVSLKEIDAMLPRLRTALRLLSN